MTTYLLDTHTLLCAISAPDLLGARAHKIVADPHARLLVSSVSAWEISIKHQRGHLPDAEVVLSNYGAILERLGATELLITSEHAILAGRLNWSHRDLFDRMLAAQSISEGAVLLTSDSQLSAAPGVTSVWA